MKLKDYCFIGLLILVVGLFFKPFLLEGKIPIPADTIVGMYHPFRDYLRDQYPRGFPFKNFLITDPVRQQYPWRYLSIASWKKGKIPWWNPYHFSGTPLLANFQAAAFYPLNFLFFLPAGRQGILPFNLAWLILISLQPLLAGLFLYLFLRNLNLGNFASFFGALSYAFSGFFVAWLEWGTIGHTVLWLPLVLLAIDKGWGLVFLASLLFSFLAGHLQTAFYVFLVSFFYLVWRKKLTSLFAICYLLFAILSLPQWWPTFQLIQLSARGLDLDWQKPGWFIPWQHLIQFFAPDFFGNPTTLNYWGEWNYAEFVGFIGVIPLILAFFAFHRFFTPLVLLTLSFALPTFWAKIPYQLNFPLISTTQPTRLLSVVDFCLAVLAAFGLEKMMKKEKNLFKILLLATVVFGILWSLRFAGENLLVSRRNLILPTAMLVGFWLLIGLFWSKKLPRYFFLAGLLFLVIFDLLRFAWKFTPFAPREFIFPQTKTIEFLKKQQKDNQPFRLMATDKRILPPNFASVYQLEEIGGYDPLYLRRYGELIAAMERNKPDISSPFGFNRIIVPERFESKIVDFLNVKYVLSLSDLQSDKLKLVFQEAETKIYENKNSFPRAFLVYNYQIGRSKEEVIELIMSDGTDLKKTVILEEKPQLTMQPCNHATMKEGRVEITKYSDNKLEIKVDSPCLALLVLSDAYYPGWRATIDGQKTEVYRANYHYRAVIVPEGQHQVVFSYSIWPK